MTTKNLASQLVEWRRDFHRHPETGFLEMRTASIVADYLDKLGFTLQLGKEVMAEEYMMGRPSDEEVKVHVDWAKEHGAKREFLEYLIEGHTGIVATLDTGREGPTIAFRVDMDALPVYETKAENHVPNKQGFRSIVDGNMHACGHDAHTAIGLGLATMLSEKIEDLSGVVKLIFQPAEEGTRGAKSMVKAGVVDDVDYFIAIHVGTGVPSKHFVASNNGFLATSKIDITFKGRTAHAGSEPEEGSNSLLAASTAALNLYAIARHSSGATRINVGELQAGSGRNVIPGDATLKIETRGETANINDYMKEQVEKIVQGAAKMYDNDVEIDIVGEGINSICSPELATVLHEVAEQHRYIRDSILENNASAGSEDATYFMEAVKTHGGYATYAIFGTELAAGHHNEKFDINEEVMLPAVEILFKVAKRLVVE